MRWGMVQMYLWKMTASAAPTASAVLAAATPDSIYCLLDSSSLSNWCLISPIYHIICMFHQIQWMVLE
ncbi:hypothetical protein, partial [Acinetobacter baumannii]|uniref:hypothetical protein n=1 Tax=Acinetobacter baumannii TaxID=470 RepID=UPI00196B5789